ncbi:unnamed protein product, partial [Meganyctiphanes norvegica]
MSEKYVLLTSLPEPRTFVKVCVSGREVFIYEESKKHIEKAASHNLCLRYLYSLKETCKSKKGTILEVGYLLPVSNWLTYKLVMSCLRKNFFFWTPSDSCALTTTIRRYAVTVWYLNQNEREAYLSRRREQ